LRLVLAEQILSLNKLAFRIGVAREVLEAVAKVKAGHYEPFTITETKRDGRVKKRRIDNPDKAIRNIQRRINKKLLEEACKALPAYTTGSIPHRSTYDNAQPHTGQDAMLLVDISDCFPSIRSSAVYDAYKNTLCCSPPVAKVLTKLTTYGDRLPQGAPTSPSLCNLVLAPLVAELNRLASSHSLAFTQYVDDLTFSGDYNTLRSVQNEIVETVQNAGFKVSRQKLKLVKSSKRMEVTGLVVNQKVAVGRRYLRRVQRDIISRKLSEPSVAGKISYVKSISKSHAKKLTRRLNNRNKIDS
jgi:RNA-directed DNA polymerase